MTAAQVYAIVLVAAFLPMVAWFEVLRSNPVAILMAPTRRLRIQAWAAAACSVPFPLLVALPGKYGSSGWTDRLVEQFGYELGTTEIAAAMTVLAAVLPTGAMLGLLALWNARHPGPARTATTSALLTAWFVGVTLAGWALGHPRPARRPLCPTTARGSEPSSGTVRLSAARGPRCRSATACRPHS